jgi:hypothetical protein
MFTEKMAALSFFCLVPTQFSIYLLTEVLVPKYRRGHILKTKTNIATAKSVRDQCSNRVNGVEI